LFAKVNGKDVLWGVSDCEELVFDLSTIIRCPYRCL